MPYTAPIEVRLWNKISPEPNSGCWLWAGAYGGSPDRRGYGQIWWRDRRRMAHRVAYEVWRGPIPDGLQVDHLCRTPECVNPAHLEPVTPTENVRRSSIRILTAEMAAMIYKDARQCWRIADEHGVAEQTILDIKIRRCWRDATEGLGPPTWCRRRRSKVYA